MTTEPVADAEVSFRRSGRVVITDRHGGFAVAGIEDGADELNVRRLGYVSTSVSIVVREGMPPLTIRIAPQPLQLDELEAMAERRRFVLAGMVIDSLSGYPVGNVQVRLERSKIATMTDSAGRFSARVRPDEVITVSGLGYLERTVALPARLTAARFEIRVVPDPYVLPRLEAIAGTFSRIEKLAARTIVWDEAELVRRPHATASSFLQAEGLTISSRSGRSVLRWRSSPLTPYVFMDGKGVSPRDLAGLPMLDVYRIIYGVRPFERKAFIAIYTKTYVRMQERTGQPVWNPMSEWAVSDTIFK